MFYITTSISNINIISVTNLIMMDNSICSVLYSNACYGDSNLRAFMLASSVFFFLMTRAPYVVERAPKCSWSSSCGRLPHGVKEALYLSVLKGDFLNNSNFIYHYKTHHAISWSWNVNKTVYFKHTFPLFTCRIATVILNKPQAIYRCLHLPTVWYHSEPGHSAI